MVVDARIGRAGQGEHPGADGLRQAAGRCATAVAMGQRGEPLLPNFGQKPADMPHGQAQELRGGLGRQDPGLEAGQDMGALLLLLGQGNRLPVHAARVTDSLIC